MTEVSSTAGADGAEVVVPLLSTEIPVQLSRHQGTGLPPLPLIQGPPAKIEMFPGSHHLPGHGVQVVALVLRGVIVAVAGLEGGTLVAGCFSFLISESISNLTSSVYCKFH